MSEFSSPLDRVVSELDRALPSLRQALALALEGSDASLLEPLGKLAGRIEGLLDDAQDIRDETKLRAEVTRPDLAIDQAWRCVRLFQAGVRDDALADTLRCHASAEIQGRYSYPVELRCLLQTHDLQQFLAKSF